MTALHPSLDDARWEAVVRRRLDPSFVYGVVTTGIYCRTGCPSRRPRRENVLFYESVEDAERAGLRACLRCRPKSAVGEGELLLEMVRAIQRLEAPGGVEVALRRLGVEPTRARRIFRSVLGVTPSEFARAARGARLRGELADQRSTVTQAMLAAGYNSSAAFYEEARGHLGMAPGRYRQGAPGEVIRFALGESSIGSFSVAATDRGVCAVALGDDPEELLRELQDRFHSAELVGADPAFERVVGIVTGHLDGEHPTQVLPLDVVGTAFQQRVWRAIQRIPPAETATYREIAEQLGAPRSSRAVANACGQNPVAVVIPCHRVVRTDGSLGGYRWGIARKRQLLDRERSGSS